MTSTVAPGVRRAHRLDPAHVVDVFVYVIVLNLAAQLVPQVIAESFAVSLAVAVVLKLVLEVVLRAKKAAIARLRSATTGAQRVVRALTLGVLLPGSKIVVLELIGFLFPAQISLGGFWSVTGLIVALLLARRAVRWLLRVD